MSRISTNNKQSLHAKLVPSVSGTGMLKRFHGNPILRPEPSNPWESLVVCNPGVWLADDGLFYMLYRAAGHDTQHTICFGLATSTDGFHFERVSDEPILTPSLDGPDAGCIEDPRIVRLDGHYYITYAYRAHAPGQYWLNSDNSAYSPNNLSQPSLYGQNMTASGLLISDDLKSFRRLGRITRSNVDDRDVILFPNQVRDQYALLHRPMQWVGPEFGTQYPAIWLSLSKDLMDWPTSHLLARNEFEWERKLGGATPPIWTEHGWFVLYHAVDDRGVYRIGAMLLDLENPLKVTARCRKPIMEPAEDYELNGLYPHAVVFPTANVVKDGTLFVYYGCADQTTAVATADFDALLKHLRSQPWA